MAKAVFPSAAKELKELGVRMRAARMRRNLTMEDVAERAGISRHTLGSMEDGSGSPSMSSYMSVLKVFNLLDDFSLVAADDAMGRRLQDLNMNQDRARAPKRAFGKP